VVPLSVYDYERSSFYTVYFFLDKKGKNFISKLSYRKARKYFIFRCSVILLWPSEGMHAIRCPFSGLSLCIH